MPAAEAPLPTPPALRCSSPSPARFRTYRARWWVLGLGTFLTVLQGAFWSNWGPIANVAKPLFGWDNGTIALLANWGPLLFVVAVGPSVWLLDTRGLRTALIVAALLVFAGAAVRAVPGSPIPGLSIAPSDPGATLCMHVGQALNALAGPVAMSAGPPLSQAWFAPHERTTATAIMTSACTAGGAVSFLGPWLVPQRDFPVGSALLYLSPGPERRGDLSTTDCNRSTDHSGTPLTSAAANNSSDHSSDPLATYYPDRGPSAYPAPEPDHDPNLRRRDPGPASHAAATRDVWRYMAGQAVASGLLLLCCIIYCPSHPPTPPSRTASRAAPPPAPDDGESPAAPEAHATGAQGPVPRALWALFPPALPTLLGDLHFWILATSYGAVTGFFSTWGSMLGPNLQTVLPPSVAEADAGWLGFYATVAGALAGVAVGFGADRGGGQRVMRLLIAAACAAGALVLVPFALCCDGLRLGSTARAVLYASGIGGGLLLCAAVPLFYELAVERAYPAPEGLTVGLLTTHSNVWGIVFLTVPLFPGVGTRWMNWAVVAAAAAACGGMLLYKETHRRLDIDASDPVSSEEDPEE